MRVTIFFDDLKGNTHYRNMNLDILPRIGDTFDMTEALDDGSMTLGYEDAKVADVTWHILGKNRRKRDQFVTIFLESII